MCATIVWSRHDQSLQPPHTDCSYQAGGFCWRIPKFNPGYSPLCACVRVCVCPLLSAASYCLQFNNFFFSLQQYHILECPSVRGDAGRCLFLLSHISMQ